MKLAISFGHGLSPSAMIQGSIRFEEFNFDFVWVSESTEVDALSVLGSIATSTSTIGIGSGIVNVYSRTPAQLAMSAATIDELSNGRFALGLGASSKNVVLNWHGLQFSRQIERVRKTVLEIKDKLSRNIVPYSDPEPRKIRKIPIVLACVQDRMTSLSKEVADGALFFMRPLTNLRKVAPVLSSDSFNIFATSISCVSSDVDVAEKRVRKAIAFYLTYGESYRKLIVNEIPSIKERVESVRNCWLKGRTEDSVNLVPKELLDEVAIYGTAEEVRRRIETDYACISGLYMLGLRFDPGEKTLADSFDQFSRIVRV